MGKHWGNSSSERSVRARTIAVRCLSGGVCLSLAVLTFGFQGLAGGVSYVVPSAMPATGVVGPGTLDPGADVLSESPATPGMPSASPAPGGFTADALALVAFSRSTVETATKEGVGGELNVASAGLKRPPVGSLMAPLETLVPSSPFGLRTSPLTGTAGEFHWGQDYAAACGTRVYAADAGVVRAVGWHPWGGGNRVEIDHGNGLITTYNHLEAIAVKKGDSVRVGEVIARVGTTGNSTGCHLHFETILNGAHTDPLHWSMIPISQVDPLGPIEMTSYAPDAGNASNAGLGWAIPVRTALTPVVAGGAQEPLAVPLAAPASPAATEAAAGAPPSTPSDTPSVPATPSATTVPATPSGTTPPATPSAPPLSPGTATPPPTLSVTPTPSETPTPSVTPPVTPSETPAPATPAADPPTATPPAATPSDIPAPPPAPAAAQTQSVTDAPVLTQTAAPAAPAPTTPPVPAAPAPEPPAATATEPGTEQTATPQPATTQPTTAPSR